MNQTGKINVSINTGLDANIEFFCGSTGAGKSHQIKQAIKNDRRICVFDIEEEYAALPGFVVVTSHGALKDLMIKRADKAARISFIPKGNPKDDFEFWGHAVFAWRSCTVVADELASVTSPGKAPPGWLQVVTRGRKRGLVVYGGTQRPSESDKTVIGNATRIHCGRMTRLKDQKYMSDELNFPLTEFEGLKNWDFIRKDMKTGECKVDRYSR